MLLRTILATMIYLIQNWFRTKQSSAHLRLIFLGVFGWSLVGCNLNLPTESAQIPTPSPSSASSADSIPNAGVTFKVQIPPNSPVGQPVIISLLDEVTGLALNVRRYEMQVLDEMHYQVELSLPVGTIIKYRYGRQGDYLAEEHTSIKKPVRYRLYRVDGPGVVEDVVSAWSDTPFTGSPGRIVGSASDAVTGRPVPNLLVNAGGAQTLTASDGTFLIEGLPPGIHNLVVYAMDGAYHTFQQGAEVAADSATLSAIQLVASTQVPVTFQVQVPDDTMPGIPIRLAGNLSQLGNVFADLAGGTSAIASRMPSLFPGADGQYQLTINLPVGADLEYKYTLGDGFWNAEHSSDGNMRIRRLIVPETPLIIQEQIDSWGAGFYPGPLIFDLNITATTPPSDQVSIQFNPFGWTEPISMWPLGNQRWVFVLYNPVQSGSNFAYRYCRNDQCGSADDGLTPGMQNQGRLVELRKSSQTIQDTIETWAWYGNSKEIPFEENKVDRRDPDFVAGLEFQPDYHPSWGTYFPETLADIQTLYANWVILTPSWTFTRSAPVVLEPVLGKDPTWQDTISAINQIHALGLEAAIFPSPHFPDELMDWWGSTPRDFAWWLVWFERYRSFLLHHADLAQLSGAQALVLGGEWVTPALPGGFLPDGTPSNVPADAESRWEGLIVELRDRFKGQIIWAMPASPDGLTDYPDFIDSLDMVYLLWSLPLTSESEVKPDQIRRNAQYYLDTEVLPFQVIMDKPVILGLTYPSAEGSLRGCVPDPGNEEIDSCLAYDHLSRPWPDIPEVSLDLEEQFMAYEAVFKAVNNRDWIAGIISRGYYPPAELQDKSISIHGKPVEDLLEYWYPRWVKATSVE